MSIIRFFSISENQNRFSIDFGFWPSIGFRFDYYSIQIDFIRFFWNRIGALPNMEMEHRMMTSLTSGRNLFHYLKTKEMRYLVSY